jgi:hypothetical protein
LLAIVVRKDVKTVNIRNSRFRLSSKLVEMAEANMSGNGIMPGSRRKRGGGLSQIELACWLDIDKGKENVVVIKQFCVYGIAHFTLDSADKKIQLEERRRQVASMLAHQ